MSVVLANKYDANYTGFWTKNSFGVRTFDVAAACYAFGFIWFKNLSFEDQQKNVPLFLKNNTFYQWNQDVKMAIANKTAPASLPWVNMQGMVINNQVTPGINLDDVSLYFTNLQNSSINTSLNGSTMINVDIDGSAFNITGNNSTIAGLSYTQLTGSLNLTNCSLLQNQNGDGINNNAQVSLSLVILNTCSLSNWSFQGNNIAAVLLTNVGLKQCNFINANITSLRINSNVPPSHTSFAGMHGNGAMSQGTSIDTSPPQITDLSTVDFSYATINLSRATIPYLNLTSANFTGTVVYDRNNPSQPMTGEAIYQFFIANGMSPTMASSITYSAPSQVKKHQEDSATLLAAEPTSVSKQTRAQEKTVLLSDKETGLFAQSARVVGKKHKRQPENDQDYTA